MNKLKQEQMSHVGMLWDVLDDANEFESDTCTAACNVNDTASITANDTDTPCNVSEGCGISLNKCEAQLAGERITIVVVLLFVVCSLCGMVLTKLLAGVKDAFKAVAKPLGCLYCGSVVAVARTPLDPNAVEMYQFWGWRFRKGSYLSTPIDACQWSSGILLAGCQSWNDLNHLRLRSTLYLLSG